MLLSCPAPHAAYTLRSRVQRARHRAACSTRRGTSAELQAPPSAPTFRDADLIYKNWLALPIQPGRVRRTVRRGAGPGVWLFEQSQGVLDVLVNTRMVVVQLQDGSLFVHAPIAPTPECVALVRELKSPVRYIVLPTSAVEHKVFLGPFAKCFPEAEVYAAPGQWSFPLNLPLSFLGLFPRRLDGTLGDESRLRDGRPAPWAAEVEHALLEIPLGLGPFVEVVFYFKNRRTLLVTDTVIAVGEEPPEVCAQDPRALLVRSKDTKEALPTDSVEARRRGWGKTVLFALFFQPAAVAFSPLAGFTWSEEWRQSFARLMAPVLMVPPILQALVLNKRPRVVRAWSRRVARWPFDRIIPAHLSAPIAAGPRQFEAAFSFLDESQAQPQGLAALLAALRTPAVARDAVSPFGDADMKTIRSIDNLLAKSGVIRGEADAV